MQLQELPVCLAALPRFSSLAFYWAQVPIRVPSLCGEMIMSGAHTE